MIEVANTDVWSDSTTLGTQFARRRIGLGRHIVDHRDTEGSTIQDANRRLLSKVPSSSALDHRVVLRDGDLSGHTEVRKLNGCQLYVEVFCDGFAPGKDGNLA